MKEKSRIAGNINQMDYDQLWMMTDDCKCYALTNRDIAMIFAQTEYMGWKTRYKQGALEIEQDEIDKWRSDLERRLMSGCCDDDEPIARRYNDDGLLEVQYEEGGAWTIDKTDDPRFTYSVYPPMAGADGSEKKCNAAASGAETFKQDLIDALDEGMAYTAVYGLLLVIIAPLAGIAAPPLAAVIAGAVMLATIAVVQAAFNTAVYDRYQCNLYCNMEDDASFTEAGWQSVKGQIYEDESGVAAAILHGWVNAIGPVGLTNAARSGRAQDDNCEDCGCDECGCLPENMTQIEYGADVMEYDPLPDTSGFATGSAYAQWFSIPIDVTVTWPESHCFDRITFWGYQNSTITNPTAIEVVVDGETANVDLPAGAGLYNVLLQLENFHNTNTFIWRLIWGSGTGTGIAEIRHADPWACPPPE